MKEINIIPEPKKIIFRNKWIKFDGIKNINNFIRNEFNIPSGSFIIIAEDGPVTSIEIKDKKIYIRGNKNTCYSTICQIINLRLGYIPEIYIEEEFKFAFRGFHIDLPRGGVPTLDYFKKLLRLLFISKYNYFAIYFEDLFPWKKYPQIGQSRGKLTEFELNEIIRYGNNLGIKVFPSLEFAGHMERILSIPEFNKYSEWQHYGGDCLNISDPSARKFVYHLLKEVIKFFYSAEYIHIGGDETWLLGRGKSLNKTLRFTGPYLYELHHRNMIDIVLESGKKPILWGDMLTGMYLSEDSSKIWKKLVRSSIWDKTIIANWDYSDNSKEYFEKKIDIFKNRQQLVCPGFSNWGRFYPDYKFALKNIKNFITAGKEKNVVGFLVTSWGDDGAECMYSSIEPLIVATMEIAEGKGNWENKWLTYSGEKKEILELRIKLGDCIVDKKNKSWRHDLLKQVMFRNRPIDKKTYKYFYEIVDDMEQLQLPSDMQFIKKFIKIVIKKIDNKLKIGDVIDLCREYKQLWLKERKQNNLDTVINKFRLSDFIL